jgi:hypothetical protein
MVIFITTHQARPVAWPDIPSPSDAAVGAAPFDNNPRKMLPGAGAPRLSVTGKGAGGSFLQARAVVNESCPICAAGVAGIGCG